MLPNKTTIVRNLTDEEIAILKRELTTNYSKWEPHFFRQRHDTDGLSMHLHWTDDYCKPTYSDLDSFPETAKILSDIAGDFKLGRVYWHRLQTGQDILRHIDTNWFIKTGRLEHRYQIYLETSDKNELRFDDQMVDAKLYEHKLVDFTPQNYHSYCNHSVDNWYFLVFDVLN